MGVLGKSKSNIRIKFSNKFLPSTLANTSLYIDELMRMEEVKRDASELREF